jgi:ankyrin repeat protein
VEAGANLNLRNFAGSTALIMASQYGKSAAAQYLVEHGASIDAKDKHGFNALSFTGFHSATVNAQKDQIRSILNVSKLSFSFNCA